MRLLALTLTRPVTSLHLPGDSEVSAEYPRGHEGTADQRRCREAPNRQGAHLGSVDALGTVTGTTLPSFFVNRRAGACSMAANDARRGTCGGSAHELGGGHHLPMHDGDVGENPTPISEQAPRSLRLAGRPRARFCFGDEGVLRES